MKFILLLLTCACVLPENRAWINWSYYLPEFCRDPWIPANVTKFHDTFRDNVFGQPLVEKVITRAVFSHLRPGSSPQKALVLSFQGWPGVGKNWVSSLLVRSVFSEGLQSKYYKHFNSRIDFPLESERDLYKRILQKEVNSVLQKCERAIFVFDEIDMMPPKVIDGIKPYLDNQEIVQGVDPRKAVYIFLSNKGGRAIADITLDLWKSNIPREKFEFTHFREALTKAAYNEAGGLQHSDNINSFLISYYVPFLPLQKEHIEKCIEAELRRRRVIDRDGVVTKEVLEQVVFTKKDSPSGGLFAVSGCKNIDSLVATAIVAHFGFHDEF